MITKDHLLERIIKECKICMRLFTKLPEGSIDYRPAPGQRSTLELLRYLSIAIAGSAHAIVEAGRTSVHEDDRRRRAAGRHVRQESRQEHAESGNSRRDVGAAEPGTISTPQIHVSISAFTRDDSENRPTTLVPTHLSRPRMCPFH